MKFDNKYIKIKNGKKEITLHNYTYDRYLALFSKGQYTDNDDEIDYINTEKELFYCFIKFDDEIDDITSASISDFDISITRNSSNVIGNVNSVTARYDYMEIGGNVYDISNYEQTSLEEYVGRKITALGFGTSQIMSCVDTSNYNIRIFHNEVFAIFREDVLITDGEVSGIDLPLHLAPISNRKHRVGISEHFVPVYARLYSIGLGTLKGQMAQEYIIGTDINIIVEDNTTFSFNLLKGTFPDLHPSTQLYAGIGIFPTPLYIKEEKHPQLNLYAGTNQHPLRSDFNYIIYKYKLYYYDPDFGGVIDLEEYYTLSYENHDAKGLFNIKTKIERRI